MAEPSIFYAQKFWFSSHNSVPLKQINPNHPCCYTGTVQIITADLDQPSRCDWAPINEGCASDGVTELSDTTPGAPPTGSLKMTLRACDVGTRSHIEVMRVSRHLESNLLTESKL